MNCLLCAHGLMHGGQNDLWLLEACSRSRRQSSLTRRCRPYVRNASLTASYHPLGVSSATVSVSLGEFLQLGEVRVARAGNTPISGFSGFAIYGAGEGSP